MNTHVVECRGAVKVVPFERCTRTGRDISVSAMPQAKQLCNTYDRLVARDEVQITDADANKTKIRFASVILEAVMIKWDSETPWFDRPIVDVPPSKMNSGEIRFPEEIKADLARIDRIV